MLTTAQVADFFGVSVQVIPRLIKNESLPAYKVGRDYRFKQEEIEAWLRSKEVHTKGGN